VISRTIALLTVTTLLVACGSSTGSATVAPTPGASGPGAAPGASTASAASPSAATVTTPGTSTAPASSGPAESPEPSVDSHGVPALEQLLPAKIGSVVLERISLTGADFYASGSTDNQTHLDAFLKGLGKKVSDLQVGDAYDPSGLTRLEVGAFQVVGAKPDELLSGWVASTQASKPGMIAVTNTTVDGRALTKLVDGTRDVGKTTYAYAKGDTIFLIAADDLGLVSSALAQLPKP
jgi:hypothetical protein